MRLFSKKGTEKRGLRYSMSDQQFLERLGLTPQGMSAPALNEATYFTCLRILSDNVSMLPLKTYKYEEEREKLATEHYLYPLLALRPNANMSAVDFWRFIEFQRNHEGHAVVVINRLPNGKVEGLYPVPTGSVQIWVDDIAEFSPGREVWYIVSAADGKQYKLRSDEVLHFKNMTQDGITGMAVRHYLKDLIGSAGSAGRYANQFFGEGLSVGGVLQYTGDLDKEGMLKMKRRFEAMATGIENAGKILPVPLGFNFQTIRSTMVDADFLNINQYHARQIAAAFGIQPHHLNDLSGSKYNAVEVLNDGFYRQTLLPILTNYEQEIAFKLLTTQERDRGMNVKFNVDALLRASLTDRYEAYRIGIAAGFLTPNEARMKENMPSMDGADVLLVNGSYTPIQHAGSAYGLVEQEVDNSTPEEE